MIEVKNLSKQFGKFQAVDNLSFNVEKGEVLGFLGPNGAGKSTTMRMLTCLIPPTSGSARVCGYDISTETIQVRQNVGYLPESAPSYQEMFVDEFLAFIGAVKGLNGKDLQKEVDRVLEMTTLKDVRHQVIETLSKGYRQRTCLAQALLANPPVLILDEPTDGLDPNQKHEVRMLIKNLSEARTILVSTHILEEVEAVCSRAIIIGKGKMVADATPEELLAKSEYHNAVSLSVKTDMTIEEIRAKLQQIPGVKTAQPADFKRTNGTATFQLFPKEGQSILSEVEQFIQQTQLPVEQLYAEKGRLDEVFRKLTLDA